MSPLDAAFLDAEDEEPDSSLAIASIAIFKGTCPDLEEITDMVARMLPRIPRYRQKVRHVPLDLGMPRWVDDPEFSIGYHVRQTALPAPGGDAELRHLMARLMGQRLDRGRPLWEAWVVEGLSGGRWAMINKVHHSMADGVSGTGLLEVLLSPQRHPVTSDVADDWAPDPEPGTTAVALDAVRDLALEPWQQVRALTRAARTPRQSLTRLADTGRGLLAIGASLRPAHRSTLAGTAGRARRYRWAKTTMAQVAQVREAFGGTMNDVMLAVISGAFRALLLSRGEECDPHAVRTLVPVSVRAPGEEGVMENRVSAMLPFLPVELSDPVTRLQEVRSRMAQLKSSKEAIAGEALASLATLEPSPLVALATRLAFRVPQHSIITVTTNVPGPRTRLYALGRPLVELLPYVPIASNLRFGIAIMTYAGLIRFGITGDFDSAADIDVFSAALESSMAELVAAAAATHPENGAST